MDSIKKQINTRIIVNLAKRSNEIKKKAKRNSKEEHETLE